MHKRLAPLLLAFCVGPAWAASPEQPTIRSSFRFSDEAGVGYELKVTSKDRTGPAGASSTDTTLSVECVSQCKQGKSYREDLEDGGVTGVLLDGGGRPRVITIGDNGHHYRARVFACEAGSCGKIFDEVSTSVPAVAPDKDGLFRITIGAASWVHNQLVTQFRTWAWDGQRYSRVQSKPKRLH